MTVTPLPTPPATPVGNRRLIIGGLIVLAIVCGLLAIAWFGFIQPTFFSGNAPASTPVPNLLNTPTMTSTPYVFNDARETNTPLPSGGLNIGFSADATATPHPAGVSPQMALMLKDMGYMNQYGVRTTTTPVPGAGPSVEQPPAVPVIAKKNDAFQFLRDYFMEYRTYVLKNGIPSSLYDLTDHVVVWIFRDEQNGNGKRSVTTDGGKWINCNLESFNGCDLTVKSGQVFVMAELNDSRVDNSKIKVEPFYNGSTLGHWGMWLTKGKTTVHLTTGLIYIPEGTDVTVTTVTLK